MRSALKMIEMKRKQLRSCLNLLSLLSMSRTMGIAWAAKWKAMKKKSFIHLPSDIYSLAYLVHRTSLKDHALRVHSWKLVSSPCCPVRHTCSSPNISFWAGVTCIRRKWEWNKSNNDDCNKKDNCVPWQCDDCSGTEVKNWWCITM